MLIEMNRLLVAWWMCAWARSFPVNERNVHFVKMSVFARKNMPIGLTESIAYLRTTLNSMLLAAAVYIKQQFLSFSGILSARVGVHPDENIQLHVESLAHAIHHLYNTTLLL